MCNEQDLINLCESFGVLIKNYFGLAFGLSRKVRKPGGVNVEHLKAGNCRRCQSQTGRRCDVVICRLRRRLPGIDLSGHTDNQQSETSTQDGDGKRCVGVSRFVHVKSIKLNFQFPAYT